MATKVPGYRLDKSNKLVPIKYKLSRPAEYAKKNRKRYRKATK